MYLLLIMFWGVASVLFSSCELILSNTAGCGPCRMITFAYRAAVWLSISALATLRIVRACALSTYRFVTTDCGNMPVLVASEALGNRRVLDKPLAGLDLAIYNQSLFNDSVCSSCACCFEDKRPIALLSIDSMLSPYNLHDL